MSLALPDHFERQLLGPKPWERNQARWNGFDMAGILQKSGQGQG
jgi:hypothetical protein